MRSDRTIRTSIAEKILTKRTAKLSLTGNEAIVRGGLEAGVGFVSGYPGTPASEIGDIFREVAPDCGISYEDSINEKVAVETAFAASILGVRSLAAMKHLGLAYAGDPVGTISYVGTTGGFVIVSGGDPGLIVSPNEQDQRYAARMAHIPAFDPASPQQAYEMCRFGFSFSEQTNLPVLLRTTIQVNFARGVVETGTLSGRPPRLPYKKSPEAHVPIPSNARRMRSALTKRIAKAEALLAESPFFPRFGAGKLGIVTSGVSLNYVLDAVEELSFEDKVQVLHLGCVYPIPPRVFKDFFQSTRNILVVEELLPFVEETLKVSAQEVGYSGSISGKSSGHIPEAFALDPDIVREAVASFVEGKRSAAKVPRDRTAPAPADHLAPRPPVLCAGCSHRSAFFALKLVLGDEALSCNDIGCYTLGYGEPLDSADTLLCMGSSITTASAASRLGHKNSVAYIGDSTFFHSGLRALANAVRNKDDIIVVVMDNQIVAMTGHQSSFAADSPAGEKQISIENVSRAMGAKVWVVDPDDLGETVSIVSTIAADKGVRVLVTRKACALDAARSGALRKERVYRVDRSLCRHCGHEGKSLYCGKSVPNAYQRTMARSRVLAGKAKSDPGEGIKDTILTEGTHAAIGTHDGAPCARACPVNICIQGYVGRVAAGNYAEALAQVRMRNPLPVISSFVCHRPCESACVAAASGEPVEINRIKEFLVNWEREKYQSAEGRLPADEAEKPTEVPERPAATNGKVAVIGAGPAGLACAADLVERGYEAVIFDAHDKPGGMLEQAIPAYRLPRDMLAYEIDAIRDTGVEFVTGWKLGEDNTVDGLFAEGFKAVCVAIGAHKAKGLERLNVIGPDGKRLESKHDGGNGKKTAGQTNPDGVPILYALDFLKRNCAGRETEIKKSVLVVGGGDCAIDAARTSSRLGAESVTVLYRRSFDEMPARRIEIDEALGEGTRIVCHCQPAEVYVGKNGLEKVVVQKTRPGELDDSGRRKPEPVPGEFFELDADMILLATGEDPSEAGKLEQAGVEVLSDGTIVVDADSGQTSRGAVFAAGDAVGAPRTVLNAIASGKRAALGIDVFLSGGEREVQPLDFLKQYEEPMGGKKAAETVGRDYEEIEYTTPGGSYTAIEKRSAVQPRDFARTLPPIDEEQARDLASRCMLCGSCGECSACLDLFGCPAMHVEDGKVAIDEVLCTGCGVCALFCPNHAIVEAPLA